MKLTEYDMFAIALLAIVGGALGAAIVIVAAGLLP